MIFNEKGYVALDEMIAQEPSFQKIMEDGMVTDEELQQQSDLVLHLLHEVEERFDEDEQLLIKRLLAETNVLSAIYKLYELQHLK